MTYFQNRFFNYIDSLFYVVEFQTVFLNKSFTRSNTKPIYMLFRQSFKVETKSLVFRILVVKLRHLKLQIYVFLFLYKIIKSKMYKQFINEVFELFKNFINTYLYKIILNSKMLSLKQTCFGNFFILRILNKLSIKVYKFSLLVR